MGHNCSLYHHYCKRCQRMTHIIRSFDKTFSNIAHDIWWQCCVNNVRYVFGFIPEQLADRLIWFWFLLFKATFSNISAISWRTIFNGGRSRGEPSTMDKQLVNFITCGCESSAPFFVIYKAGRKPTPYWW